MWNNFIIVVTSPSGGGKTTLCKMLKEQLNNIEYSISATTRPMRKNEIEGKNYHFMTEKGFIIRKNKNHFAEYAYVHDYWYGTPRENIDNALSRNNDILMDVDVQGAMEIKKKYPNALMIFIVPPSMEILRKRLKERGTDNDAVIEKRLKNAEQEMSFAGEFEFIVENNELKSTYKEIENIVINKRRL
ncbi:guanylate kinase [candidate division WOR-3 bacterium]|nr:guanylate kinase [candidate division WOR-3 bacterium]